MTSLMIERKTMELEGKLLDVDVGTGIEGKETKASNVSGRSELDYCHRCFELEEKCKRAEERCGVLELEIERKKREFELLESEITIVTVDKLSIEYEFRLLEKERKELENRISNTENRNMATTEVVMGPQNAIDSTEEEDKVFELMMENEALKVEVRSWEAKCKDLGLQLAELEKSLHSKDGECARTGIMKAGVVSSGGGRDIGELNGLQNVIHGPDTPAGGRHIDVAERSILCDTETGYGNQAQKQLVFEERTPARNMAPVTPASARWPRAPVTPANPRLPPVCPIDISDSDDEANTTELPVLDIQARKMANGFTDSVGVHTEDVKVLRSENNSTWSPDQNDEDDVPHCNRIASSTLTAKRKRTLNMVTSDSGSDNDDNLPIGRLRTDFPRKSSVPALLKSNSTIAAISDNKNKRRRLVPLRKQYQEGTSKKCSYGNLRNIETQSLCGNLTNGTSTADETEEDESDTEDESLDGFIVGSSDSEGDNASKGSNIHSSDKGSAGESDDDSDRNMDYGDIISRIGRRKDHLINWAFEADMLSAFGKDPELCMRAVCALYRRQTSEEKLSKSAIFANQRGFSQSDATRGSILGEFLTDGDPLGDLKKSVKELQEHHAKGVELCRSLATHYSKQLFAMYQNKEDPLWPAFGPN